MKIIDLTQLIEEKMPVYPGDDETSLKQDRFLEEHKYNNFSLKTGMHVGTHIDSPMHLTECSKSISEYDLTQFIGNGCLLDVRNESEIAYNSLFENKINKDDIVLFYTGFDKHYGSKDYYYHYPKLSKELASLLIRKQVKMVGFDTPSPDYYPFEIHKMLFNEQILIIENLANLHDLVGQTFTVYAIPIKVNADSAIARVFALVDVDKC